MPQNPYPALKAAGRLPTPPGVAMRILQLVESEETSIGDLTQAISSDPALTSKILKYMNSPLVGLGFHGSTLPEAVARIGMRGAQMLALSFSLVTRKQRESCPSFDFDRFWSESLARAVAARVFAIHLAGWDPEEALITGLLCRIGKLVLSTGMPEKYEPLLAGLVHGDLPLRERERRALGADHLEIGMQLLKDWRLPEIVWRTAGRLAGIDGTENDTRSTRIIMLADTAATLLVEDRLHSAAGVSSLAANARAMLEIDAVTFRGLLGRIGQDWISYGRLLSVPTQSPPDLDAIERQAEEHRTALRLASEVEVQRLRTQNEQLADRVRRDRLTGLLNRAAFDEALPEAIEAARAQQKPLALLLVDADHFEEINGRHGQAVGDAVLAHLARVLDDNVRKRDEVFRLDGGELAVIAPNCPPAGAGALAKTLCDTIATTPHGERARTIPLTVSIGAAWAHWPDRPAGADELVEYANRRLYEAKRAGRNTWRLMPRGDGLLSRVKCLFARSG